MFFLARTLGLIVFLPVGTTGRPKGVTLSHSSLIVQSLAKIAIVGYGEDDVWHFKLFDYAKAGMISIWTLSTAYEHLRFIDIWTISTAVMNSGDWNKLIFIYTYKINKFIYNSFGNFMKYKIKCVIEGGSPELVRGSLIVLCTKINFMQFPKLEGGALLEVA